MVDISKCSGEGCDKRESCYRFTAKGSEYQSYFVEPPIKDGECEYFWEVDKQRSRSKNNDPINSHKQAKEYNRM